MIFAMSLSRVVYDVGSRNCHDPSLGLPSGKFPLALRYHFANFSSVEEVGKSPKEWNTTGVIEIMPSWEPLALNDMLD